MSATRYRILTAEGEIFDTVFRGAAREDAEEALAAWGRSGYDTTGWTIIEAEISDDRSGW